MPQLIRLLSKKEYSLCIPLFNECFGEDAEFTDEYFGSVLSFSSPSADDSENEDADICSCSGSVRRARIAALFEDGSIISMVHIMPKKAILDNYPRLTELPYIMCVCTSPRHRHKGCMDKVMNFCIELLRSEGFPLCFLVAVDRNIYRHLDFIHDIKLTPEECELLYADDGLDTASACLLNTDIMPEIHITE
ncbi:MAG: GNAT family N-acetyltransferase [Eubacteriales bacterium]|nr:GNAT family N-acetyltransferase [Eubacteriales bacterium]